MQNSFMLSTPTIIQHNYNVVSVPHGRRSSSPRRRGGRYSRSPSPYRRSRYSRSPSPYGRGRSRSPRRRSHSRSPNRSPSPRGRYFVFVGCFFCRMIRRYSCLYSRSPSRSPIPRKGKGHHRRSPSPPPVHRSPSRSV